MQDTATKASANLGGPVNASLSILIAADLGYSWIQIIDAIEVEKLNTDGSISGVLPEGEPQKIISTGEHSIVAADKTLFITVNTQSQTVEKTSLVEALGKFEDSGASVLDAILNAICNGYSPEQIVLAIISDTLYPSGLINCLQVDMDNHDCMDGGGTLIPNGKIFEKAWADCKSLNLPNIEGIWKTDYGYWVTITGSEYKYTYTGEGAGNFKHTGVITWYNAYNWYEGNLADVEGFCCGNVGYIWLKVKDEKTISIKSYWTTPDGILVKDNTETWEDLTLYSHEVD